MTAHEPSATEVRLTRLVGGFGLDLVGSERVLDFGSGSGVCSKYLAARLQEGGGHLTCLDVSRTWNTVIQKMLKCYLNVDYLLGDIAAVGIPDKSFDAVVSHFALHDIPATERRSIVEQWARVLKTGGKAFVREPIGSHGIPGNGLQHLMADNGFDVVCSHIEKLPLMGLTVAGTFRKM
jgi:ubiquinone/menaquinone biosynthesis C-methylase UbiE